METDKTASDIQARSVIPPHLLQPHLLHLQKVKFRVKSEEIGLSVTSLQSKCQIRLMKDQGDLLIPKPIKPLNQIKKNPRKNRVNRCVLRFPEWLQEFREKLVNDEIPAHGFSHANSSHEVSLEPKIKRREDLESTVFIFISIKTEIARSAGGPKSQGPRPLQKTHWYSRTSCRKILVI